LISCSYSSPEGGSWALVGKHDAINPAGRVRGRDNMIGLNRPGRRTRKGPEEGPPGPFECTPPAFERNVVVPDDRVAFEQPTIRL
jgi:hypothetical protein